MATHSWEVVGGELLRPALANLLEMHRQQAGEHVALGSRRRHRGLVTPIALENPGGPVGVRKPSTPNSLHGT